MLLKLDIDPVDVDADGICQAQTPAAGGVQSLTINGALTSDGAFHVNDTAGHSSGISGVQIAIVMGSDESGRTFTIVGTDENGLAQTSTIAGTTPSTVEDVEYWQSVTSITTDANTAGAITVGTVDEIITRTIPLNYKSGIAATVAVSGLSGTCQFGIDQTFDNVTNPIFGTTAPNWIAAQASKSADLAASLTVGATATRLKFDSYSSGAELQFHVVDQSVSTPR